jgi:flagellar biosynthesis protein FlhG
MFDQAQALREQLKNQSNPHLKQTRVVTVTSGKGGVGKSNFSLNFALGLIESGKKVVILDVDLGLANIDVLMGLSPKNYLFDMIDKGKTVWDVLEKGPNGLEFISGGTGFSQLLQLSDAQINQFMEKMSALNGYADYIILDTGAGLSNESLRFIVAADDVVLVTTPEPTSITDAYAVVKIIHSKDPQVRFKMVVNRVNNVKEGKSAYEKIALVSKRFLNMDISSLGYVHDDAHVSKAVKRQVPFFLAYPSSVASLGIKDLVHSYLDGANQSVHLPQGVRGFLKRMINHIK